MNKQQALEAVLRKVRLWERPDGEVRLADPDMVFGKLLESARALDMLLAQLTMNDELSPEAEAGLMGRVRDLLGTLGAAAVYLMTDEVTVVEGESSSSPTRRSPQVVVTSGAAYEPAVVNGATNFAVLRHG